MTQKNRTSFMNEPLLVLDLKEGLVECATVCVKSVVILLYWTLFSVKTVTFEVNTVLKICSLCCAS